MDPISDAVFGDLEFNGSWKRELELTFLGQTCIAELIIEGNDDDESILDEQRASYRALPDAIPKAENGILKYYQRIREEYRPRLGDEADVRMPAISRLSELATVVRLTSVVFPMVMHPGESSIGFLLECSWEPEHGLGVKIENDEVHVGTQDILT